VILKCSSCGVCDGEVGSEDLKFYNVFHISRLRKLVPSPSQFSSREVPGSRPPPELVGESLEYTVERIIGHEDFEEGRYYLVKWLGYDDEDELTLEPIEHLENALELVSEYLISIGEPPIAVVEGEGSQLEPGDPDPANNEESDEESSEVDDSNDSNFVPDSDFIVRLISRKFILGGKESSYF